jgi:hypothetical protein
MEAGLTDHISNIGGIAEGGRRFRMRLPRESVDLRPAFSHTTVTNRPGRRCHENLFKKLRGVLQGQGRWPFGGE